MPSKECTDLGGIPQPASTLCELAECETICPCPGDLNGDGVIDSLDIQEFVELLLTKNIELCGTWKPER